MLSAQILIHLPQLLLIFFCSLELVSIHYILLNIQLDFSEPVSYKILLLLIVRYK